MTRKPHIYVINTGHFKTAKTTYTRRYFIRWPWGFSGPFAYRGDAWRYLVNTEGFHDEA